MTLIGLRLCRIWKAESQLELLVAIHVRAPEGGSRLVGFSAPQSLSQDIEVPLEGAVVEGDIRISVFDANASAAPLESVERGSFVSGKEPGCLFFFLFHTAYLEECGQLVVTIGTGMDKAWKRKGEYNMDGQAVLSYCLRSESDVQD